jgi:N-acetylmuramic acid 6-phosphate (MurNAc-6-P) etherase
VASTINSRTGGRKIEPDDARVPPINPLSVSQFVAVMEDADSEVVPVVEAQNESTCASTAWVNLMVDVIAIHTPLRRRAPTIVRRITGVDQAHAREEWS